MWASDQGFECVLTIADPRYPDKKLGWLDDDGDVDHLRVEAEVQHVKSFDHSSLSRCLRCRESNNTMKTVANGSEKWYLAARKMASSPTPLPWKGALRFLFRPSNILYPRQPRVGQGFEIGLICFIALHTVGWNVCTRAHYAGG